jgi:plastocyanin
MNISRILILAALLSFTHSMIASSAEQPRNRSITVGGLKISDHGTKDVKSESELDLEADDYYFAPTFLRGTAGHKLKLEIENESSTLHNFSISEQRIDMDIPPKGKVMVEVVFPSSGVVRFFCKFHSALGMNGMLLTGDAKPQAISPGNPK